MWLMYHAKLKKIKLAKEVTYHQTLTVRYGVCECESTYSKDELERKGYMEIEPEMQGLLAIQSQKAIQEMEKVRPNIDKLIKESKKTQQEDVPPPQIDPEVEQLIAAQREFKPKDISQDGNSNDS